MAAISWLAIAVLVAAVMPGTITEAASNEKPRHIRVLLFGDSLTEGMTGGFTPKHSYAVMLGNIARVMKVPLMIDVQGASGELVVPTMTDRFKAYMQEAQAAGKTYDWIVIWGGTNDLGWAKDADTIMSSLRMMYKAALAQGSSLVAVNIMDRYFKNNATTMEASFAASDKERVALNKLIAAEVIKMADKLSKAAPAEGRMPQTVALFDAETLMSTKQLSKADQERFRADILHLTDRGYDQLAQSLWDSVIGTPTMKHLGLAVPGTKPDAQAAT